MTEVRFSTRPLYLQVRDLLVRKIVLGEWPASAAIANENLLAQECGVSVGTIRKALETMEVEGIVCRRQGRGTFVNDQSTSELSIRFSSIKNEAGLRIEGQLLPLSIERGAPSLADAKHLAVKPDSEVLRIKRVHVHKGRPFMVETCVLPSAVFPKLPKDLGCYRICAIAQDNRVYLGRAEEKVSARLAVGDEPQLLDVEVGSSVLVLERIVISVEGQPVEWRMAACLLRESYYSAVIN